MEFSAATNSTLFYFDYDSSISEATFKFPGLGRYQWLKTYNLQLTTSRYLYSINNHEGLVRLVEFSFFSFILTISFRITASNIVQFCMATC